MPKFGRMVDSFSGRRPKNALLINAPFGTSFTRPTRVRIVGSKLQTVEDEAGAEECVSPRLKHLEKNLTERVEKLEKSVYNGASDQNQPSPRGQPYVHQWNEPQRYSTASPPPYSMRIINPYTVIPPIQTREEDFSTFHEENKLYEYLPRDRALTIRPLQLNNIQTTLLYKLLTEHCSHQDTPKLKDIYLSLVSHDLRLTGYVPFEAFRMVFHKYQVHLPLKLLRLLGSMYVSTSGVDMVQYEKILIFIGAALKNAKKFPKEEFIPYAEQANAVRDMGPIPYERPAYYQFQKDNMADHISPRQKAVPNRPDIGLQRKLGDQIVLSPRFDVENLRQNFMLADRTHRGTLSSQQIKTIVGNAGLNLGEELMDDIIRRCDDFQGQVKWDQFLQHIERVQPLRTGLHIPDSRRPKEQAPTPRDSWPRQEGEFRFNGIIERLDSSPKASPRGVNHHDMGNSPRLEQFNEIERRLEERRKADGVEAALRDMGDNYQQHKAISQKQHSGSSGKNMSPLPNDWFARFMKLADALYKNDVDHRGSLPLDEVRWLVGEYNDIYALNIPISVRDSSLQAAARTNGQVDIYNLITSLANTRMKDENQ